jgi:hypothetical protein
MIAVPVKQKPFPLPSYYAVRTIVVILEIYIIRVGPAHAQHLAVTIQAVIGQDKIVQQLGVGDLKHGLGMREVSIGDIHGRTCIYIQALLGSCCDFNWKFF